MTSPNVKCSLGEMHSLCIALKIFLNKVIYGTRGEGQKGKGETSFLVNDLLLRSNLNPSSP